MTVRATIATGRVDTAQVYFNLINPTAGRAIPDLPGGQDFSGLIETCVRNDVGIIAIRTLAAGVLASAEPLERVSIITPNTEKSGEERMAKAIFDRIGDEYGNRAQTAIRFALSNPDISCIDYAPGEIGSSRRSPRCRRTGPPPLRSSHRDRRKSIVAVFANPRILNYGFVNISSASPTPLNA